MRVSRSQSRLLPTSQKLTSGRCCGVARQPFSVYPRDVQWRPVLRKWITALSLTAGLAMTIQFFAQDTAQQPTIPVEIPPSVLR